MKSFEERRRFTGIRWLAILFFLFGLILSSLIPLTNLSQVNPALAAPLGLPPETQYAGSDTGTTGDDRVTGTFNIGFNFTFYGNTYDQFQATTNGLICFNGQAQSTFSNTTIPNTSGPNNCVYAFWDDLMSYGTTQPILYRTIGDVGSRMLIVQWTNYGYYNSDLPMGTFQAILYEGSNNIRTQYRQLLTAERSYGQSATIGLENSGGSSAVMYSYNTPSLDPEQSILWTPSGSTYTYNDGAAYEGVYLYKDNPPPNVPALSTPSNGSAGVSTSPTFVWNAADGATSYNLVVSTYSNLSSPIINQTGLTSTSYAGSGLSTGPTYYWGVEAINAYGNSWSSIWSFTTAAGNSAPSNISLSNNAVAQDLPSGTTVGTFTTTDPDEEDTHTYALVEGGGSSDNPSFSISGSTLLTAASLSPRDYTIRVRSTDGGGLYVDKVFTISVTEPNVAPTDIHISHLSMLENRPAGYEVATFSTEDANTVDNFTYTFVSGTGDTDNSAFTITGSSLTINAIPDYETKASYAIRVRSTDSGGLYTEKQFTINVLDVDDDTSITITSDTPDPTVVGQPYTVSVSVAPAYGAGTPTGQFSVSDGAESCNGTLSSGTGSCSLTSTTAGTKSLEASYSGAEGWNYSSTTTSHTVNQADTTTAITSITPEPSELGDSYTVFVSVTANPPSTSVVASGTVVVSAAGVSQNVPITNGTGSYSFDGTATGNITVTANYQGESGKFNTSSTSATHVVQDTTPPEAIINQASYQPDPTNVSPIHFQVYFDEPVTGFEGSDIDFTGSTAPGTLTAAMAGSGDSYDVYVSGMTGSGTVTIDIPFDSVVDLAGNGNTYSWYTDRTVTYDVTPPAPTINQADTQEDPTSFGTIVFEVEFGEPVTGFTDADVDLSSSSAPGTLSATVHDIGSGSYLVTVSGMTDSGTVVASIPADAAIDAVANNSEASSSTDNSVTYDVTLPEVTINQASTQADPVATGPIVFDVEFSEPVTGFTDADVDLSSSTAPGTLSASVSGSGSTYQVSVSGMADSGLVIASIPADSAMDAADNANNDSTSTDNSVTFDMTDPTVTIEQAATQIDPTRFSPIIFEVVFDEPVTGFEPDDIDFTGSTAPGTLSAAIGGTGPIYNVLVSGMTDSGLVAVSIPANAVIDASGNDNAASTSTDNSVTYDVTPPSVTINQGASQADPSNTEPIVFDVVFSEDVIGFNTTDLVVDGMANPPVLNITGSGAEYEVEVSGLLDGETVTVEILEMAAVDASGNENTASTSMDNSVLYDITCIEIMEAGVLGFPGNSVIQQYGKYVDRFNEIEIDFDSDAFNPPGDTDEDDVTNPDNYYLIEPGENGLFEITNCADAYARSQEIEDTDSTSRSTLPPEVDDLLIPVGPVTYDNNDGEGPFVAKLTINNGENLSIGTYRLLLCGSTTIMDLAMNPLNGGEDVDLDFTIEALPEELPMTGFTPGKVTDLPLRIAPDVSSNADMVLALPKLGISAQIIGVPLERDGWNTTWLGNYAGYLEGSAFPTWDGNTVITGHVWTATNKPGIFLDLNSMNYGDEIRIYAWGQVYTYTVRSNFLVSESNVASVMKSETADVLTLMTCDGYDPETDTYLYRRVIRAILVSVE
jgi:LPXTG-site transpeptidase (sortase) family protein